MHRNATATSEARGTAHATETAAPEDSASDNGASPAEGFDSDDASSSSLHHHYYPQKYRHHHHAKQISISSLGPHIQIFMHREMGKL